MFLHSLSNVSSSSATEFADGDNSSSSTASNLESALTTEHSTDQSSSPAVLSDYIPFSLPGNLFYIIHILACCSLAATVTVSVALLFFICLCSKHVYPSRVLARQKVKTANRGVAAVSAKGQNDNDVSASRIGLAEDRKSTRLNSSHRL